MEHSGLEHFTVRFKWDTYSKHLDDNGHNAMAMYEATNCWIRNVSARWGLVTLACLLLLPTSGADKHSTPSHPPQVRIVDATNGIFMSGNEFVTATDIDFDLTEDRARGDMADKNMGVHGHHAMQMAHGACE